MMKKVFLLTFIVFSLILPVSAQENYTLKGLESINKDVLQAQLGFLSSDWMEGRKSGEKGEAISSDYIASMLRLYGLKPGGDITSGKERSYFQTFDLLKSFPGSEQVLKVKSSNGTSVITTEFTYNVDFYFRPSSRSYEIEAPVIFAGYGFKSEKLKFNDLAKSDVKGKFILKISGIPAFAAGTLSQEEITAARTEFEAYARSRGAAGIIEFDPSKKTVSVTRKEFGMSPAEDLPRPEMASYSIPSKESSDYFPRLAVSVKIANELLKGTGNNIDEYLSKADVNETYNISPIDGKSIYLKTTVNNSIVRVRNIIGIIEGSKPDEIIVMGAHYDHMGMSNGYLWNGADDNGSGTVGVLTIAKAIMNTGKKPDKTIIAALWTAEEEGLLGSRYFVQNLPYPLKNLKMNVNFDMISRYISDDQPDKVVMTYTDSKSNFKDITVSNLKKYGIKLDVDYQPSANPPGGSDHRSFVESGIPVMRFKPGHREEYHTPADEITTIDWDIMEKIVKISFANVWELANSEW